ncbi:MAG: hypothetical protein KBF62_01030 [Candidatus Pacebacteria bacterium]|nr:hypothetical protein [Candidatus Paceibacterota bacterium]MBP9058204.1 hypothetical protein [Candidatus Paceibacterota bacterium]MBP9770321.1 hypothetical protein [Candidatus Paceibacterota bacterium]
MNKLEKDLNKIKNIKLRADEKALIRANISDRINARPQLSPYKFDFSPYVLISNWNRFSLMKVGSFAVLFMFIFGSSLTYASEQSLPGETLYSIKVNVKEEIEIKLAGTSEKKASVEKSHIEKRLEEISALKESGDLTEENSAIAIEVFKQRTEDLHDSIDTMQEEGKSEEILEITQDLIPVLTDFVEESAPEEVVPTTPEENFLPETSLMKEGPMETETAEVELTEEEEASISIDLAINSFISIATEEVEKMIAQETEIIEEVREENEQEEIQPEEIDEIEVKTETEEVSTPEISTSTTATSTLDILNDVTMIDFGVVYGKVLESCISINEDCTGKESKTGTILIYTKDKETLVKAIDIDSNGQFKTRLAPGNYVVDIRRIGTEKVLGVPEVINVEKDKDINLEINVFGKDITLGLPLGL